MQRAEVNQTIALSGYHPESFSLTAPTWNLPQKADYGRSHHSAPPSYLLLRDRTELHKRSRKRIGKSKLSRHSFPDYGPEIK